MADTTTSRPTYLTGQYAPVVDETESCDLPITGTLPPQLAGRYFRNGPNPLPGEDPGHWFSGHGMIHGIRLRDGRAEWYRNRWVRTSLLAGESPLQPDGKLDLAVNPANTHVIEHAGRLLALCEAGLPYELSPELDALGPQDFGGRLTTAMTAHPKQDPITGELHFFGYGALPPYVTYHRLSADGQLVRSTDIDVPGPTMMHDFAITEHHIIWLDLPVVFDFARLGKGLPFQWSDSYGARIGVMPKEGPAMVRWFDVDPCYVFHVGNAREDAQGRIVLDAARYPAAEFKAAWSANAFPLPTGVAARAPARLHRWVLDPTTGSVREEQLAEPDVELPTINESRIGLAHRYLYTVQEETSRKAILKYDVNAGSIAEHRLPDNTRAGEAVFVPSEDSADEDAGWLVSIVTTTDGSASQLLVLDASDVAGEPVATVRLPRGVPAGFHGSWIPDA